MAKSIRKKKWYRILATPEFKNQELGETYCDDASKSIGRKVKIILANLIGDMRKQNIVIIFRIKEVKGDQLNTELCGYEVLGAHIKRLVRKGRNKIDYSFIADMKDKTKIMIKPIILTRRKTKNKVLTEIRKRVQEYVKNYCSKNDFNRLISSMINLRMQLDLKKTLSKVYPIASIEFRKVLRTD